MFANKTIVTVTLVLTLLECLISYGVGGDLDLGSLGLGSDGVNTPPVLHFERRWVVAPQEKVGMVVTRVRATDADPNAVLAFGLESEPLDGRPLPFEIEESTGVVRLNESIAEREGDNILLWVTVSDGELTSKNQVFVTITNATGGQRISSYPGGWRPPLIQLPGLPNNRPPPPPPGFPINGQGSIFNNVPIFIPSNTNSSKKKPGQSFTYPQNEEGVTKEKIDEKQTTQLLPTETKTKRPSITQLSTKPDIYSEVETVTEIVSNRVDTNNVPLVSVPAVPEETVQVNHFTFTVIAIASISALLIIASGVIVVVWKRIYPKRTKTKKDDMSKHSSGEIVLQDAGWGGPRAHSNRYEPWENGFINQSMESDNKSAESRATGPLVEAGADRWEFPRHRLRVLHAVGEGAFGQVWLCHATDIDGKKGVTSVAVKTLKENASIKERADLLQELRVMKSLEPHPNVVRLLACCTEKEPVFLVMEFIALGKLQSYLRQSRAERHYGNTHAGSRTLTSRDLTSFVYQVARGMEFLASKGIVHRDLAARNVLIDAAHACKVADFGFARDILDSHVYERKSDGRLPIRWMAPESLYDDIFSVKSDVWSFGVLMWEVVTLGSTPYPGLSAADVMRKVRDGHRLEKPEHCRRELYNIMYYCWDEDPAQRPSFPDCAALLEKLLLTETDYIELERFPDHSYYNVASLSGEKL